MQMQALFFVLCGILSVKGTPFYADSSVDLIKLNKVNEQLELISKNFTVTALNSNKTQEVEKPEETIDESALIVEYIHNKEEHNHGQEHAPSHNHGHGHEHGNSHEHGHGGHGENHAFHQMGPVELGLRNLVSASAIAAEELSMEMATLSVETSDMIRIKSELLTAHTMNEIFKPLNLVEGEIKKSQECGKPFVEAFSTILGQIDGNLKSCTHNLTLIGESYKNQSIQILSSMSGVSQEIQTLPESCEITDNFAIGTFCIVNNLAEINNRVVLDVKNMKFITAVTKEVLSKATSSAVACQKKLIERISETLKKLYNEVETKCNQQVKPETNEI